VLVEIKEKAEEENTIIKVIRKITGNAYLKFVLKKCVFYFVVFFVAVSFAYLIPRLIPGDPLRQLFIEPPGLTEVQRAAFLRKVEDLRSYLGLDLPPLEQYINFWINFLRLDFGPSYSHYPIRVRDYVIPFIPYTMVLVIPAMLISFFFGNLVGGRLGFHKSKKNTLVYYLFIFLMAAPFYWLALIIMEIFVHQLGLVSYTYPPALSLDPATLISLASHYILPFLTLLLTDAGGWATGMRSMTIHELDQDYMWYSKKLGFSKNKRRQYAQRNAILPQLTGLNLRFNALIGATLIIEYVFLWPGLGDIFFYAATGRDYPLIIGTFIITIIIVVFGNFLIDITYGFIDPRIRTGHEV